MTMLEVTPMMESLSLGSPVAVEFACDTAMPPSDTAKVQPPLPKKSRCASVETNETESVTSTDSTSPTMPTVQSELSLASAQTPLRRSNSILKMDQTEEIPLNLSKRAWKQLPQPKMRRVQSMPDFQPPQEAPLNQSPPRRESVTFADVHIRNYDQTIGDNPSVGYGPPISLDWGYDQLQPVSVDDYEDNRPPRRKLRNMMLSYYNRKNILSFLYDHSEDELKQAEKEANKAKRERYVTKVALPLSRFEHMAQSAKRKAKRIRKRTQSIP